MDRRGVVPVAALTLTLLFVSSSVIASQANMGFAAYEVTVTLPSGVHSAFVNETVRGSDKAGFSDLVLQFTGGQQNLTYSRLVNSSGNYLPYLPTIASQSFDYSNGTRYSIHANLTAAGTKVVTFQGSQYTLSVSSFAVRAAYGNRTFSGSGTIETFPSSLVYSISVASGGMVKVEAVLQGTNLPLVQPTTQSATMAYVGAGLGVGGIAIMAALLVKRRERKAQTQEQKPLHWVD